MRLIRWRTIAAALCLAAAVWPGASGAQSVDGVLVDGRNGLPVPDVFVQLIDIADVVVDTATTDRSGRFLLRAGAPGAFVISARRAEYADLLSDELVLEGEATVSFRMELTPLSLENMRQIAEVMDTNARLRNGVVDLCRGRMDPINGGILLGVVRERGTDEPVGGARARMLVPAEAGVEVTTAITDAQGAYVFCFAPTSDLLRIQVEAEGFRPEVQEVEVRSGTISWYDFTLRRGG